MKRMVEQLQYLTTPIRGTCKTQCPYKNILIGSWSCHHCNNFREIQSEYVNDVRRDYVICDYKMRNGAGNDRN